MSWELVLSLQLLLLFAFGGLIWLVKWFIERKD